MTTKKPPVVDHADVEHMINFLFGGAFNEGVSPEERADAAHQVALGARKIRGHSNDYAEAQA